MEFWVYQIPTTFLEGEPELRVGLTMMAIYGSLEDQVSMQTAILGQ
jgi:hypothetical protein